MSYIIQLVYIVFTFLSTDRYEVTITSDNISSYRQGEKNYKIIFVALSSIAILLDTFLLIADANGRYEKGEGILSLMTLVLYYGWGRLIYVICSECNIQNEYNRSMANLKAQRNRELANERIEIEFNNARQKLFDKYGECTTDVCIGDLKAIKHHIYIFEDSATIVLNGEAIAFNKILGFTLQDDSKTISTSNEVSYTSMTKTSIGSMLGRAAVAGMFTGGLGAVAGAATAKKKTITTPNQSQSTTTTSIKHNYVCYVNVNDLSNPIREIFLGENSQRAQKVANILNVIIERNK